MNIHWKSWCWSWSSDTLETWCKEPAHWKRPWCYRRCKRRWGRQRMRWSDGITDSMDMSLSKLWKILRYREAWHATVHGETKSPIWLSAWTTNVWRRQKVSKILTHLKKIIAIVTKFVLENTFSYKLWSCFCKWINAILFTLPWNTFIGIMHWMY